MELKAFGAMPNIGSIPIGDCLTNCSSFIWVKFRTGLLTGMNHFFPGVTGPNQVDYGAN